MSVEPRLLAEPPRAPPEAADDRRVVVVVCDSLGVGAAGDAEAYGDADADTLGHVAGAVGGLDLPVLGAWGLGRCTSVRGVEPADPPEGVVARLAPRGAGKDSTTGHWELMGCRTTDPFPLYPEGFPREVIDAFESAIGRTVLGNRPASGTVIIEELGEQHLATARPIVYTSGDSVFQVAAHLDVVPLTQLYDWCRTARALLTGRHRVGRVIARPFTGPPGSFERTAERRDFAVAPPGRTACDIVHGAGIPVKGVGKIEDLFDRRGVSRSAHTGTDADALAAIAAFLEEPGPALVLANLVDLDQRYGHRNDPEGYAAALERIDRGLGEVVVPALQGADRLMVTADHGTDPTITTSTDHTRERVPLVSWGPGLSGGADLGVREMVDVAATILELFGLTGEPATPGASFARELD